jgi:hypothetical protein
VPSPPNFWLSSVPCCGDSINAASGRCYPSYEAKRAGCARSTVYHAIRALERVGVLSWVNRLKRVREYVPGLFGNASAWRARRADQQRLRPH